MPSDVITISTIFTVIFLLGFGFFYAIFINNPGTRPTESEHMREFHRKLNQADEDVRMEEYKKILRKQYENNN